MLMASKTKDMGTIKQVLRLHSTTGKSNRQIAEDLGLYKGTVNKYVKAAEADPLGIPRLLEMDDMELEKRIGCGSPAYSDKRFEDLQGRIPGYLEELSKKGSHTTREILWREYISEVPEGYGYTQFCFHLNQYKGAQKLSFVMEHTPGEKLYVDFAGDTMSYVDLSTGEVVKCQLFVATFPASDYGFALAVRSQQLEDFLFALEKCLRSAGGVPKIIVTDNLKSAVTRADRYVPESNKAMEDFCNHFGCVHIPTRPAKPKDKSLVEDHVKIVYRRVKAVLRNRMFHSLEELNEAISSCMKTSNQTRMQRIPYTREERFIALDKPALSPLNPEPFEIKYRAQLTVGANSFVYLTRDRAYYSVPFQYMGWKVDVIYTRSTVSIYANHERVAVHKRTLEGLKSYYSPYVMVESHLPSYYNRYVKQSPQMFADKAAEFSETFRKVIDRMFSRQVVPEMLYKSCEGLIHLQKATDPELFEKACGIALKMDMCKYGHIKNLVESKCRGYDEMMDEPTLFPADHDNIRGANYYLDAPAAEDK